VTPMPVVVPILKGYHPLACHVLSGKWPVVVVRTVFDSTEQGFWILSRGCRLRPLAELRRGTERGSCGSRARPRGGDTVQRVQHSIEAAL